MPRPALCVVALCVATTAAFAQTVPLPVLGGGAADVRLPIVSWRQSRTTGTLLQQYDFSCGSAAVATLLTHHYGETVNEQTVFEAMYLQGDREKIRREGFSLLDMKRFLASRGYTADGFEQPLDKLAEARVPAIALIDDNGYHHFVVIKGLRDGRVLIGDPARGTRALSRRDFESRWKNGLLFVIHNRMESARFNQAADWRSAPQAPLASGTGREGLAGVSLPKLGPGDF